MSTKWDSIFARLTLKNMRLEHARVLADTFVELDDRKASHKDLELSIEKALRKQTINLVIMSLCLHGLTVGIVFAIVKI